MALFFFFSWFRLRSLLPLAGLFSLPAFGQTLGGQTAYNFLKMPASPLLSAAGGVNVSYQGNDVGSMATNPSLLNRHVAGHLQSSFNAFLSGTNVYALTGAFYAEKITTTFGGHIQYLDYGSLPSTDASGNVLGQFRPVDYVVQASAAKQYQEKWTYGMALKLIHSSYGIFRSTALAADVGVLFQDSAAGISASVLVRNMGTQLKTYAGETEELPFELQAGFTKRLKKAPFAFSFTAQQLQQFDILYNDTLFNRDNFLPSRHSTLSKIVSHLVLAAHIYAGQNLEATVGYNFLRRHDLNAGTAGNGFTGFSAGLRARFNKLQVFYARTAYQRGVASNQIGLTLHLNRLFGIGW